MAIKNVPKIKNLRGTGLRLFKYFRENIYLFIAGMILIGISAIAQILANYLIGPIIDAIIEEGIGGRFLKLVMLMLLNVGVIVFVSYMGNRSFAALSLRTTNSIRRDIYSHIQRLPVSYFDSKQRGEIMSTVTNDVDMLSNALQQGLSQLLLSGITIIGTAFAMLMKNPELALIVFAVIGVIVALVKRIGKRSAKSFKAAQAKLALANGYIEELISGQKIVQTYNYMDRSKEDFEKLNEDLRVANYRANAYGSVMMPLTGNMSYFMYTIIAVLGGLKVIKGVMTYGDIASFLQYTRNVSRPITQIAEQMNNLLAAVAGAERIFEIMDVEEETDDGDVQVISEGSDRFWLLPGGKKIKVEGRIKIDNVDFGYNPEVPVLKGMNLEISPGEKLAIVGPTGAGKTTIANLINRFYDPTSGKIYMDGIDISEIKKKSLRSVMSQVLQDVSLFEESVQENIRFGREEATDDEIDDAIHLANADYFISRLPEGKNTVLYDDGSDLSQGERQLLAIARAALANPAVLILDEATSSVDTRTEKLIGKGMDRLMKGRTTLVIAHRLSTIRDADKIIVLSDGRISEMGNHDELMEQKGIYYNMNTHGVKDLDTDMIA